MRRGGYASSVRWLFVLLAGCSGVSGTGTIVFTDVVRGHVMALNLTSGGAKPRPSQPARKEARD